MAINLSGISLASNGEAIGTGGKTIKLNSIPVTVLPNVEDAKRGVIYFVPAKNPTSKNRYDEYIVMEIKNGLIWELFGQDVSIDLQSFATKTDLNKKQDKLVNQQNIRSINGVPLVGAGNVNFEVFATAAEHKKVTDFVDNAPNTYATKEELQTVEENAGGIKTVNGSTPDANGNINLNVMTDEQKHIVDNATQHLTALDQKVGHINGVMGPYTEREPITLTLQENGKAINRAGVKVDKAGWAICSFIGKKGDVYSFNPGVMDGDVCIFSEEITKQESRPIEYKYTYDEEGLPLSASATYNGAIHSYTWQYERDEEGNIISETITDDQTGAQVNALPYQYQAEVGTYHPLTILNESAELPIDEHCRLISHFQGEGTIRVTVSFNVASADMNLLVFRDGLIANLATQLGTIFQMISETNKALALVEQLAAENAELIAYIRQTTDNADFGSLPTLCGQPMTLFGAGTPQEAIVPGNWNQYDPTTGEGYQWNGLPSALGQVYINTSATTNGRYTAVPNGFGNLKWVNF